MEEPDRPPVLCFPVGDVRVDDATLTVRSPLDGHVAFDHDRVSVELVDGLTTKRFPTWGDAADLVDVLDVRPAGERRYTSVARASWQRPVVEGSQMLGQAIVACARPAPGVGGDQGSAQLRTGEGDDRARRPAAGHLTVSRPVPGRARRG